MCNYNGTFVFSASQLILNNILTHSNLLHHEIKMRITELIQRHLAGSDSSVFGSRKMKNKIVPTQFSHLPRNRRNLISVPLLFSKCVHNIMQDGRADGSENINLTSKHVCAENAYFKRILLFLFLLAFIIDIAVV